MRRDKSFLLFLLTFLFLGACANPSTTNTETTPSPQPTPITPNASEAIIIGKVISTQNSNSQPLTNTEVRLAQVFWDADSSRGAFVIEGGSSPTTISDNNGSFVFRNLEPNDYVLVVGDLYGQHVILSNDDGSAQTFTAVIGEVNDIGNIGVDLSAVPENPVIATPVKGDNAYPAPLSEDQPESYP